MNLKELWLKQENPNNIKIEITEEEILEMEKHLDEKLILEFAKDYGLTYEVAKHDLADMYVFNQKLEERCCSSYNKETGKCMDCPEKYCDYCASEYNN